MGDGSFSGLVDCHQSTLSWLASVSIFVFFVADPSPFEMDHSGIVAHLFDLGLADAVLFGSPLGDSLLELGTFVEKACLGRLASQQASLSALFNLG